MANRILVSVTPEESTMALLRDNALQEYMLERNNQEHLVGNIYKGQVKNIVNGIQAAFIDVGRDKNVFLYNGEEQSLSEGQGVIVQIIKDAIGSKGPRAITQISLPGRYVVFLPDAGYVGISKKISCNEERTRLQNLVEKIKPQNDGIIVRTVAENCGEEELKRDIEYLTGLWQSIKMRNSRSKVPTLLYREVDLPIRIVRDYLNEDINELIIDDKVTYQRIQELVEYSCPSHKEKICYHDKQKSIFNYYGVEQDIKNLIARRVDLACGGYLVFDKTEALSVIDVNTGSFQGESNLENTAFLTNVQAADEIARQLRLRDIGGIIIIDFIDMNNIENRNIVLQKLEEAFVGDRMKPRVLGITNLGLVEVTRRKARQGTNAALFDDCPVCSGSGIVRSPEAISVDIRRKLRESKNNRTVLLQAHPNVAEWFINNELPALGKERKVKVQAVNNMHPECFSLLDAGDIDR